MPFFESRMETVILAAEASIRGGETLLGLAIEELLLDDPLIDAK